MRSAEKVATINLSEKTDLGEEFHPRSGERACCAEMDYEDAAKKLIMYSRGVAKGAIGTAYGMSMGEDPVLEYLLRHDEGMSPSDLAEKLGYTRPRMTRILDSLESKGYVERVPDENDRRRVIAFCTEEGRRHAGDRKSDGVASLAATLSKMGEHDARELLRGLETAYSITYNKDDILGERKRRRA